MKEATPAPTGSDEQLQAGTDGELLALHRAFTDLVRAFRMKDRDAVCCHDVSAAQSHALERLAYEGPMPLRELACALFLEKSSATRLVDGLARRGYVERRANPSDGRSRIIALTPSGEGLAARIEADVVARRAQVLEGMDAKERQAVVEAVLRLAELEGR